MSRLVIDSSITMCWCFPDEATTFGESVLRAVFEFGAIVPQLWAWEVANTILLGERRGRVTLEDSRLFIEILKRLPVAVDGQTPQQALENNLDLAREFKLTAYDAAYFELAKRKSLRLCTLDRQLIAAAPAAGVELFETTPSAH